MRDYTDAPATRMLATNCVVCHRPLLDADSVEAGIGPECRRKHGYTKPDAEPQWPAVTETLKGVLDLGQEVSPRSAVNKLVHDIAVSEDGPELAAMVNAVRLLGYHKLADVLCDRKAAVSIVPCGGGLKVTGEYNEGFVYAVRSIPGRRWVREEKANIIPVEAKADLYRVMRDVFAGRMAYGPKGLFVIPTISTPA